MSAAILDGKALAVSRRLRLAEEINQFKREHGRTPALAVILVGNDQASTIYVTNKRKACTEVGMVSYAYDLPTTTSQEELLNLLHRLNSDPVVDGILVQLPLPEHINERLVLEHIHPSKDVDGFHPYNLGRLAQRNPLLRPCTPKGIMSLLNHYDLCVTGKHAVVIGASNIVGRPMSLELLMAGSTVTICHRFTQDLQAHVLQAEILIVAAGQIDVVHPDWLHKEQIVIDVGIHRLEHGTIRGDVNFNEAYNRVSWLTPVPGGVGPMTVISLLENTLMAAQMNPANEA